MGCARKDGGNTTMFPRVALVVKILQLTGSSRSREKSNRKAYRLFRCFLFTEIKKMKPISGRTTGSCQKAYWAATATPQPIKVPTIRVITRKFVWVPVIHFSKNLS